VARSPRGGKSGRRVEVLDVGKSRVTSDDLHEGAAKGSTNTPEALRDSTYSPKKGNAGAWRRDSRRKQKQWGEAARM